MKPVTSILIIASLFAAMPVQANQELARKSNCLSCHSSDKKMAGPAFADVAKKYAGDKNAAKLLAARIKTGTNGAWGRIPMPANTAVKDADIEALVKWILAGAR